MRGRRWFVESLGNDGLYALLNGQEDHSAYCQCVLGFSTGPGDEPKLFTGRTDGRIVPPQGSGAKAPCAGSKGTVCQYAAAFPALGDHRCL